MPGTVARILPPFGTQALFRRNARAGFDTSDTHLVVRLYHLKSL